MQAGSLPTSCFCLGLPLGIFLQIPAGLTPLPSGHLEPSWPFHLCYPFYLSLLGASLVAQLVKNLPAMWESWVGSLGWEDPLEKGKATHSSILA